MPSVHETAYPRLKASVSPQDLSDVFTPTTEEIAFAHRTARGSTAKRCLLVLLKTFQRLGYFTPLRDVPVAIREHIARSVPGQILAFDPGSYDESGTRRRHRLLRVSELNPGLDGDDDKARLYRDDDPELLLRDPVGAGDDCPSRVDSSMVGRRRRPV